METAVRNKGIGSSQNCAQDYVTDPEGK